MSRAFAYEYETKRARGKAKQKETDHKSLTYDHRKNYKEIHHKRIVISHFMNV